MRPRDGATEGRSDSLRLSLSRSPCFSFSLSLRLSVSPSLCLSVSPFLHLQLSHSHLSSSFLVRSKTSVISCLVFPAIVTVCSVLGTLIGSPVAESNACRRTL